MAMPNLDDLISLAESAVKKAKSQGAEESEAYISWTKSLSTDIQGGLVKAREGETAGVGIRAVIGKRVGFAAVSSIEEERVYRAAERAVQVARIRPKDPKFLRLPDPVKRPSKSGFFDERMLDVTSSDMMEKAQRIVEEAGKVDERVVYVSGDTELIIVQFAVANSRGINAGDSGTGIDGGIYCKAMENGEERTGLESISSRQLIGFEGVGDIAAKRAMESLGAEKLQKPEKLPVIFDNYTSPMFLSLLSYGVSAMSVQEGRSALIGKLGEKVAWENLTIIDDSWMEDGLSTTKYDAEGIPTTVKAVIENGVLKSYLYDSYTAHFEQKASTGNAVRRGEAYLQTPAISPVNYLVEPGSKSLEEMVTEVDEGLLVRYSLLGVEHSNYISGDFSVVATNPFYIRDGAIAHPLDPVTIAGNAYEALMKIMRIGSDLRLSTTGKTPSVLVSDLTCTP